LPSATLFLQARGLFFQRTDNAKLKDHRRNYAHCRHQADYAELSPKLLELQLHALPFQLADTVNVIGRGELPVLTS